ncbi:MAG: hypothetical protein VKJ06_08625 [Vampirovibrionales bacterium]|nr:hypothetical protein [Vampirovibrionales bacterium]
MSFLNAYNTDVTTYNPEQPVQGERTRLAKNTYASQQRLNFSISAYRVLYVLLVLMRRRTLSALELNTELFDNPNINRMLNTETITKYVNTLRLLGCAIPKVTVYNNFRYELLHSPLPITLPEPAWNIALRVLEWLQTDPFEERFSAYRTVIDKARWAMGIIPDENPSVRMVQTAKGLRHYRHQIRLFRKLCLEGMMLQVRYQPLARIPAPPPEALLQLAQATMPQALQPDLNSQQVPAAQEVFYSLEPHAVVQRGRRWVLIGNGTPIKNPTEAETAPPETLPENANAADTQLLALDLEGIIWHKQLPYKVRRPAQAKTILFRLSGRLAQTYRLYPNESRVKLPVQDYAGANVAPQPPSLTVRVITFDQEALLCRLLRYGSSCEVLSPGPARQWMQARIQQLHQSL